MQSYVTIPRICLYQYRKQCHGPITNVFDRSFHFFYRDRAADDDNYEKKRDGKGLIALNSTAVTSYHTSAANEKAVAIILGLGTLSAGAYAASSAVSAWNELKAGIPENSTINANENVRTSTDQTIDNETEKPKQSEENKTTKDKNDDNRENIFKKWFGVDVGTKYYEGGFDDMMTRREAALILGVRETSSAARIKDAHRKLLVINHPDTGGSTYISGKINEAKELLLKGK